MGRTVELATYLEGARTGIPMPVAPRRTAGHPARGPHQQGHRGDCARDLAALPGLIEHVDGLIAGGAIGGPERNAADYQIATSISLLLTMDDLRPLSRAVRPRSSRARSWRASQDGCRASSPSAGAHAARSVRSHPTVRQPHGSCNPPRRPTSGSWATRRDRRPRRRRRMRCSRRSRARAERRGPVKTVRDAVEIGARVLDREQAGANAEFVKTEFERAATRAQRRVHRPGARGRRVFQRARR